MKNEEKELYYIVDRVVSENPKNAFTKTLRGLKLKNLEFTFATDVKSEDNCVVVMGKQTHCVRSPKIRHRLLEIYNG
jgi:hypothetical protein